MKLTGFNQLTVGDQSYDLSKVRYGIIEKECERVGKLSFSYNGIVFNNNISSAISTYLAQLEFEVFKISNRLKLGEVFYDIPKLVELSYTFNRRTINGSIKEIKEKVTKLIEDYDPNITRDGVWFGDLFVSRSGTLSKIRQAVIIEEMKRIECSLK